MAVGESFATAVKRRLLGLLLLVVIAGLVTLSIAIYNKAFSTYVEISIRFDYTGNQLMANSDVKERGVLVGSVKSVSSTGDGAVVRVNLDPSRVGEIPSNVTAQILPKTLFGEQYVALNYPQDPAAPIRAGDVIPQDRSQGALETEKVLGDILPLLTAVQPAQLNATLTAVAQALNGRGNNLGQTLVNLDNYLKVLEPHTTALVDDLKKLGQVALEYNNVAPDIFATLQNLQTSVHTIVTHQAGLASLLATGTDASQVLQGFLSDNEQRIINLTGQTDQVYGLLNEYSPEFTCLFQGIANLYDKTSAAISDNRIHLSITVQTGTFQTQPYTPGQEPKLVTGYGPNCFGLPNSPTPVNGSGYFQIPSKYTCLNDGAALTATGEQANCAAATSSATNSPEETAMVNSILAAQMHTTPNKVPGVSTLLMAPLLRGQEVTVK